MRRAFYLQEAPLLIQSIPHYHHRLEELRTLGTKQGHVVKILGFKQQTIDSVQRHQSRKGKEAESHGRATYRILHIREQDGARGVDGCL